MLDECGEADDELPETARRRNPFERRKAIDRDTIRLELLDHAFHAQKMILERHDLRIVVTDLEVTLSLHALEIEAPTRGIAEELFAAFFETKRQTALTLLDPAGRERRHHERLPRPGCPGHENDRVTEEAAATHEVQLRVPRSDADVGGFLAQLHRGERDHRDAGVRYRERILALLVRRATELEDLDRAPALLVLEDVADDHDIVGDELFHAVARNRSVFVGALRRDDRREVEFLERSMKSVKLAAYGAFVVKVRENRAERI